MQEISNMQLLIIVFFTMVPILVSKQLKIGIEKEILFSSIRGFIQLLILGLGISLLFSFDKWYSIILYIIFMIIIASSNVAKRGEEYKRTFKVIFTSISLSVFVCTTLWLFFEVVPFEARYLIPISGMFTGTAMRASSTVLETLKKIDKKMTSFEKSKTSVVVAIAPMVDMLKTIGLVQIPGTMTGMILAGADPFEAVKYQIFIIFTLVVVESITSILVAFRMSKI